MVIADLLESGMELNRALPMVAEIQGRGRTTLQDILGDLRSSLRTDRFASTVAEYIPEAEAMLFRRFGQASDASVFRAAATLTEVDAKIAKAITQALMWPVFLFFLVFVLLYLLGSKLFPTMEILAPVNEWPLSSQLVALLAFGVADHAVLVVVALALLVGAYLAIERFHAGPWAGMARPDPALFRSIASGWARVLPSCCSKTPGSAMRSTGRSC